MAAITLSSPVFYKAGTSGASKVVGYESSSNRVALYSFTAPSTGATSVSLSFSGMVMGNGTNPKNFRFYIGTSATSHVNAGASSAYTGTISVNTSTYVDFSGTANINLMPNTTYYLFVFPGTTTFGWYHWAGTASMTASGAYGASTITDAGDVTIGNSCSVKWVPVSASFRFKLKFSMGSWSYTTGAIHPNTTSAYTYTGYNIPLVVVNQITGLSGTMTVTLYTYADSGATSQVGSASSTTFTVTEPNTVITSAGAVTLGNACSVKWTPVGTDTVYKMVFSIGDWSYTTGEIKPNTTSAYTYTGYTIPLDVAKQITGSSTGTMTVALYTYHNSYWTGTSRAQIGNISSTTFTVNVPDNSSTKPTVSMELSLVTNLSAPFNTLYIQNLTKVDADITGTGKYGATIKSCQMVIGNSVYDFPYTSGYLTQTGNVTVTGKTTDSRGYVGTTAQTITVIPYAKPAVVPVDGETDIVCARCDEDGNFAESGTYLRIKAKRKYSPVTSGGVQKNFCQIRYRVSGGRWVTILASSNTASDEIDTGAIGGVVTSTTASYTIDIGVVDDIGNTASVTVIVPTAQIDFHLREGGKGAAFGEYSEDENVFSVSESWTTNLKGSVILGKGFTHSLYIAETEADFETMMDALLDIMPNYSTAPILWKNTAFSWATFAGILYKYTNDWAMVVGDTYADDANGLPDRAKKVKSEGVWLPTAADPADRVVETGTDGIWIWRKWYSGVAECWGKSTGTMTVNTAWGAMYYTTLAAIDFPSGLFTAAPVLCADLENNNAFLAKSVSSATSTGQFFPLAAAQVGSTTYALNLSAKGRWK